MTAAAAPRVLLACDFFLRYTTGLARGLADVGCDVVLLTRDHDGEFGGRPGAMREFVAETLDGRARHLEIGGRTRDLARLRDVLALRRRLGRWAPDFVHVQDSVTNDVRLLLASGFPRRRYAMTVHDPVPHPGDRELESRRFLVRRELRRHAAVLFAHSRGMVEELREMGDLRHAAEVVPHGFGTVAVKPLPEQPSLLFFGRITEYKGVDTLLEAMPLVWEALPEVTLTIAGSGDVPELPAGEDPRVTLRIEHVPDEAVAELFEAATCVVLPYREATQSGIGSEAKQYGRAMIVTEIGGLPELVAAGGGRLVPPEDPATLAAEIVTVVGTPGLAEKVGAEGAAAVGEAGWDVVAAKTLEAYRRYLA